MVIEHHQSKAKACRLAGLSRTVLYRPKLDRLARDREVIDAINEVIAKRPRWGFWKCFDRMRLDGYRFNHKRVHRVYCEMRLNMKRRTKKRILTRPAQPLVCPVEMTGHKSMALSYASFSLANPIRMHLLSDSTRVTGKKSWMPICLTRSQRYGQQPTNG